MSEGPDRIFSYGFLYGSQQERQPRSLVLPRGEVWSLQQRRWAPCSSAPTWEAKLSQGQLVLSAATQSFLTCTSEILEPVLETSHLV